MKQMLACIVLILSMSRAGADAPSWLAGCWQSDDGRTQEVWVIESPSALVGFSVSVRDDRVGPYEVMRIHRDDSGAWWFTAWPSGQAETSFRATAIHANAIVFSNSDHDYPQEIRYQRSGDQLDASVALIDGERRRHFPKRRCDRP